jgi:large conductance mechanosensitive channel
VLKEFKEFVSRGNVVELAVAFVMGVAFKPIIDAIVNRVLMPLIAMIFGQPNFDAIWTFGDVNPETGVPAGSVGAVFTAIVSFLLVAFALFFVVKAYNRLQREEPSEPEPEAEPEDVTLLREIRDALTR